MRVANLVTALVPAVTSLPGQEKPAEVKQEALHSDIIYVKSLSGDSLVRLGKLLSAFGAKSSFDEKLRVILLYAPKEVPAQIRPVVEELDWPGSEVTLGRNAGTSK